MSKVLIYSTTGRSGFEVETSAETWEGLQRDLTEQGVTYSGMKAVIGETRHTLESPKATIPQQDFSLFLMPKKTKSGLTENEIDTLSYKELRVEIKSIIDGSDNPAMAKTHFSEPGKNGKTRNYTQTTIGEMKMNLKTWITKFFGVQSSKEEEDLDPVEQNPTETIESEVVEKVEEVVDVEEVKEEEVVEKPTDIVDFIEMVDSDIEQLIKHPFASDLEGEEFEAVDIFTNTLEDIKNRIVDERHQAKLEEEKRLEREAKKAKLAEEAKTLSREFSDLKDLY